MDLSQSPKNPFLGIFGPKLAQNYFFSKNEVIHILNNVILRLCTKNQENLMNGSLTKSKNPFLGIFGPNWPKKFFFLKIGLRHILAIIILHLYTKNQKIPMIQSREKLVTDERTDGRTNTG